MANLVTMGSHSTNGVAAIHSGLLRTVTVRDLGELFPERLGSKRWTSSWPTGISTAS
jgi:glycogen phosphorylase